LTKSKARKGEEEEEDFFREAIYSLELVKLSTTTKTKILITTTTILIRKKLFQEKRRIAHIFDSFISYLYIHYQLALVFFCAMHLKRDSQPSCRLGVTPAKTENP
jgi:hypothetical protein